MSGGSIFRCIALSAAKHDYVPLGVHAHPRFAIVVVADDAHASPATHRRNQALAMQLGVPYVRDVEGAIAQYDVQVAVVSSEAERHCDLSVRAASAGLHVVQDKPMSTSVAECDRAVAAVEAAGVSFLLWSRNCEPAVMHARELVAGGRVGTPYAVHVDFYFAKDAGPPRRHGSAAGAAVAPPDDWPPPTGELHVEGIYPLAYLHALTGARVRSVYAHTTAHFHQRHHDHGVEDLASLSLEMEGGVTGTLCIGRIGAASHPDIGALKLQVLGNRGALVVDEERPEVAVYYRGQPAAEYPHVRVAGQRWHLLVEELAAAIDSGGQPSLDARAGRDLAATVAAAHESARTGQPVAVAPPPASP